MYNAYYSRRALPPLSHRKQKEEAQGSTKCTRKRSSLLRCVDQSGSRLILLPIKIEREYEKNLTYEFIRFVNGRKFSFSRYRPSCVLFTSVSHIRAWVLDFHKSIDRPLLAPFRRVPKISCSLHFLLFFFFLFTNVLPRLALSHTVPFYRVGK